MEKSFWIIYIDDIKRAFSRSHKYEIPNASIEEAPFGFTKEILK